MGLNVYQYKGECSLIFVLDLDDLDFGSQCLVMHMNVMY